MFMYPAMLVVYFLFVVLLSEASATSICGDGEVPCLQLNETCIPEDLWCDGEYDCLDGSDEAFCDNGNVSTTDQSKYVLGAVEAAQHLLNQRKADYGWDQFTPRALIALAFAEKYLPIPEKEKNLMTKRLELQLFVLLRNGVENLATLALHINALYAMCQDPRDFHGIDLIEYLRSRTNKEKADFNLPIVLLTLCVADDTRPGDFDRLLAMYNDKRNNRMGVKALTLLSMSACIRNDRDIHRFESKMSDFIFQLTDTRDGSFDVYSKALICQVHNVGGYNTSFVDELLNLQAEDGSFGDLLGTYSAIPVLLNTNLADLKCKTRKYKENSARQILFPSDQLFKPERQVNYSLWIPTGENAGYHTLRLTFEGEKTFYDLMRMAEFRNPMYRFKYDELEGIGKKVYYLAGVPNDAEKGSTWTLYKENTDPTTNSTLERKETDGIDRIFPQDKDHFTFHLEGYKM